MSERHRRARAALAQAEAAVLHPPGAPGADRRPARGHLSLVGPPSGDLADDPQPTAGLDGQTGPDEQADQQRHARRIAVAALARRAHSREDMGRLLIRKGCPRQVCDVVVAELVAAGLLDDEEYARQVVESARAGRGLSGVALTRLLRDKGVPDPVIETVLADLDPGSEREAAQALAERKLAQLHGHPAPVQARRIAAMLARRGYSAEVAYSVVRQVVSEAPEHRRD